MQFSSKYDPSRSIFNDLLKVTCNSSANTIFLQKHHVQLSMICWIWPANIIPLQRHCAQLSMIYWVWHAILQQIWFLCNNIALNFQWSIEYDTQFSCEYNSLQRHCVKRSMISWICDVILQQTQFFVVIFNDLLNMQRNSPANTILCSDIQWSFEYVTRFSSKYDFFAAALRPTFDNSLNMTRNSPANMISLQQRCVQLSMIYWKWHAILRQIRFLAAYSIIYWICD